MSARSRKLSAAESLARDEGPWEFPSDDPGVIEIAEVSEIAEIAERPENDEGARPNEPICLACGGDGSRHEGCEHAEVARLVAPSRAASEMIARLRAAAAEHRAASRALRALVTSELSRDRAELTTKKPVEAPARTATDAEQGPCPRCAEREIEGTPTVITAARASRKRGRAPVDQQSLPFTKRPGPAPADDLDDPGERTIERLLP
ncbi:MAG: hypothetical protein ABJE95_33320 [Byssovorax sp.]